jgi:hypothetical protein
MLDVSPTYRGLKIMIAGLHRAMVSTGGWVHRLPLVLRIGAEPISSATATAEPIPARTTGLDPWDRYQ